MSAGSCESLSNELKIASETFNRLMDEVGTLPAAWIALYELIGDSGRNDLLVGKLLGYGPKFSKELRASYESGGPYALADKFSKYKWEWSKPIKKKVPGQHRAERQRLIPLVLQRATTYVKSPCEASLECDPSSPSPERETPQDHEPLEPKIH